MIWSSVPALAVANENERKILHPDGVAASYSGCQSPTARAGAAGVVRRQQGDHSAMGRTEPRRRRATLGSIGILAITAVVLGHDDYDGGHQADAVPPYDGPGWVWDEGGAITTEFPSQGVHLLAWLPINEFGSFSSANDCWGYVSPSGREYAILGLSGGTAFVEITNPGNPQIIAVIAGPNSLWRDIKVYQHHAYAVSEGGSGIQVMDMTQIDNGVVTHIGNFTQAGAVTTAATHNVAIDEVSGYLYRCGGGSGSVGLRIYSLANPANPVFVGEWNARYVHDAEVVTYTEGPYAGRQIAFCSANNGSSGGNPRLDIVDVTNKSGIFVVSTAPYSWPAFAHQNWLTEDRQYVYLNDELAEQNHNIPTTTRVINVADINAPFEAATFTNGNTSIGHNIYVRGNRSFHANYRSGLRVFDTTNPLAPVEIGYFDTWPQDDNRNFNGLWSNYPFFPSGVVIGSDIEKGLFVWWVGELPLAISYPDGLPAVISPGGDSFEVRITPQGDGAVVPGSETLHYDAGSGSAQVPLTHLGGDLYRADFPPLPCAATVAFYVSAQSTAGLTIRDPSSAPTAAHTAVVAESVSVEFEDDFSADLGWVVGAPDDNATSGIWERVWPVGTSAQPSAPLTGSACYVTGQHPGGGAGANDVDNGKTTLFSPIFNLADAGEATISYWRWYSNNAGAAPNTDVFVVDITADGGATWVNVETVGPAGPQTGGGWYYNEFSVSDFVPLTSQVRVRFVASDYDPQSLVEAAVDAFTVNAIDCEPEPSCAGDLNGDGAVDVFDLLTLLGAWGACAGCDADLTGDGIVDVFDLLALLGAWGGCP
jgi:choice-of-anchor B domain-containing protein